MNVYPNYVVKSDTIKLILRECIDLCEFTGIDLVRKLNISKPTINEVLVILENLKFIQKQDLRKGNVGRRAQIWRISLGAQIAIGIEIDVHIVKVAVVDMNATMSCYKEYKIYLTNENFQKEMKNIILDYKKFASNISASYGDIKKIGISIIGDVSFDRKNILYATNLHLDNIGTTLLGQEMGVDIVVENEANASALSEFFITRGGADTTSLLISISQSGIGGGNIFEGKLQKGSNRRAGEIGHFIMVFDGRQCSCGNKGCFERYASYEALDILMKEKNIHYDSLEEFFHSDSEESKAIIRTYCKFLGKGIRSLIYIYDAGEIIISGEITKYWDIVYPHLEHEVFENNNFYLSSDVIIRTAINKDMTALIGAGLLTFYPYVYNDDVYK